MLTNKPDTALHNAVRNRQAGIVGDLLARGADVNEKGLLEQTPLHIAAQNNDVGMINILLGAGAACDARRFNDEMPIHVAAMVGAADAVQAILAHDQNQLNAVGRDGRVPLFYAVAANKLNVVTLLVAAGADVDAFPLQSTMGLLHTAAVNGNAEIINVLTSYHADVNLLSNSRLTALQYCMNKTKPAFMVAVATALVDAGADVNMGDPSPLEILERQKGVSDDIKAELKDLLVSHGARQDAKRSDLSVR